MFTVPRHLWRQVQAGIRPSVATLRRIQLLELYLTTASSWHYKNLLGERFCTTYGKLVESPRRASFAQCSQPRLWRSAAFSQRPTSCYRWSFSEEARRCHGVASYYCLRRLYPRTGRTTTEVLYNANTVFQATGPG